MERGAVSRLARYQYSRLPVIQLTRLSLWATGCLLMGALATSSLGIGGVVATSLQED